MAESIDVEQVRELRNEEQWLRYDTSMVGRTASRQTPTWKETFAEWASQDLITWNDGSRTKSVGKSYCNQSGNTEDFSQLVYQSGVEFFCPMGYGANSQYSADALVMVNYWIRTLPTLMSFSFKLQDTDEWLLVPGSHLPAGTGITGASASDAGAPMVWGGQTGNAGMGAVWEWPVPLEIAAKKKLVVEATIDKPGKDFLQQLDAMPGVASFTVPDGANPGLFKQATQNLWFGIRVWHRGPRRVQLRGAYSK